MKIRHEALSKKTKPYHFRNETSTRARISKNNGGAHDGPQEQHVEQVRKGRKQEKARREKDARQTERRGKPNCHPWTVTLCWTRKTLRDYE